MGMRKIEQKREEYRKAANVQARFLDDIEKLKSIAETIRKKQEELETFKHKAVRSLERIDAHNIAEFTKFKTALIAALESHGPRFLPIPGTTELSKVVDKLTSQVDALLDEWVDKHAASWPKVIKPGMVFKWETTKKLYEVVKGPYLASNLNLTGDDSIMFDLKREDGSKSSFKRSELNPKKKWKFIKTS
ncbi:MAG: hypothetical protein L0Y71_20490 [Gemmataceae bacterium]|nr:hypothetical protein [Gemmataceae bacterium]